MTVVLHTNRPGIAAHRSAIQSVVAIWNHGRHGDLTRYWLFDWRYLYRTTVHPYRRIRLHHAVDRRQSVRRHCSVRLLGRRQLRREKAEGRQDGEAIRAKVALKIALPPPRGK